MSVIISAEALNIHWAKDHGHPFVKTADSLLSDGQE